jgi:branched-chain amino acid transport system ATP-binding protein
MSPPDRDRGLPGGDRPSPQPGRGTGARRGRPPHRQPAAGRRLIEPMQRPLTGTAALAVEGLTVHYGGFLALDDVSLTVPSGALTALIGPNGAGKTTCFNAICGFVRPSAGRVSIEGRPVRLGDPHAVWRQGVARTFQRLELFWTLSVRENLELAWRRARRAGRHPASVDDLLELCGLSGLAPRLASTLPFGTCRIVELARALATGSRILLLDEASSGLDRDETAAFADLVRRVYDELGLSILLVEHDMEFVMSLAEQIFVLDFGRLIAQGSPAEVQASELVRRVYLGGEVALKVTG